MARYTTRTRKACLPCRERKRKCNGSTPCDTCTQSELQCSYPQLPPTSTSSTRPTKPAKSSVLAAVDKTARPNEPAAVSGIEPAETPASLLANSGSGFLRQLVGKMDTTNSPYLRATAWNAGSRFPKDSMPIIAPSRITDLLSRDQVIALARVYFMKIHPCYGFINQDTFFRQVDSRWAALPGLDQAQSTYDAVICGVAALGSYFSSKSQLYSSEQLLVALAKSLLTSASVQQSLTKDILQGWVCRITYLRFAAEPLDAWLACCSVMHLFEAVALDLSAAFSNPWLQRDLSSKHLPEALHSTFVIAQHHNVWISYELGSLLVQFPTLEGLSEVSSEGSYINELQRLLPISMDLFKSHDDLSLRAVLKDLLAKTDKQAPLVMAQCNIILCILRRLWRSGSFGHDDRLTTSALTFLGKGLAASRQMIQDDSPWHHLANVPFQTICISLALDTPAALHLMRDAVQTLMSVRQAYPTVTMTEAYNTTSMLLYLHQKQHAEKVQVVGDVLDNLIRPPDPSAVSPYDVSYAFPHSDAELARITALMPAFPILQDMDVDELLAQYTEYTQGLH
jgi:hypothetical protein